MSFPTIPGFQVSISLTADDWQRISHEIDYMLSRVKDLQTTGRLPHPKEDDIEARWVVAALSRVRIREGIELCIIPSERTPTSSAYDNYGEPAHYIAKTE